METTEGLTLRFTKHAREQMEAKKFDEDVLKAGFALAKAEDNTIYPNAKYPGQFRVIVNKVCLIGKPCGNVFLVFTVYADGVLTPPREDQLDTPYAERYARAQKTGNLKRTNEYWPRVHQRRSEMRHTNVK